MTTPPRGVDLFWSDEARTQAARLGGIERFRYERIIEQLLMDVSTNNPIVRDLRSSADAPADAVAALRNVRVYFNYASALVVEVVAVYATS